MVDDGKWWLNQLCHGYVMDISSSRKRRVPRGLAVGSLTQIQEPLGDPHMNLGAGWQIPQPKWRLRTRKIIENNGG